MMNKRRKALPRKALRRLRAASGDNPPAAPYGPAGMSKVHKFNTLRADLIRMFSIS